MDILEPLRLVNRCFKAYRKAKMGRTLCAVRRIEQVFPPPGRLVVAMTFDDGPTASPASPGNGAGLTESLLNTMKRFGARGTFDVVGTTAANYPDTEGKIGSPLWSGVKYDHYPAFGCDSLAGAVNQTALARRMLDEGHELANHGYRHVAFGPKRVVYGTRSHFADSQAVYQDLRSLHDFVRDNLGYEMRLARPPHYIDGAPDGRSAYDILPRLKYNYLAASFDGGGWKASSGDYRRDVEAMVNAVRAALERDSASLNGQIIFQKDGYNMSKESPIVDALPAQLDALKAHGYEVVTVSELLDIAPFTDVSPDASYFQAVRALAKAGYPVGFRNNSFKPDKRMTRAELDGLLTGPWAQLGARLGTRAALSSGQDGPGRTGRLGGIGEFGGARGLGSPGSPSSSAPSGPVTARQILQALRVVPVDAGRVGDTGDVEDSWADSILAMLPGAFPGGADPDSLVLRGRAAQIAASALRLI